MRSPAWYFKINESTLMMDTYRGEGRRVLALSRVRLEDVRARQLRGVRARRRPGTLIKRRLEAGRGGFERCIFVRCTAHQRIGRRRARIINLSILL